MSFQSEQAQIEASLYPVKFAVTPLVCTYDSIAQQENLDFELGKNKNMALRIMVHVTTIILIVSAALLAWDCNRGQSIFMQAASTLLAAIFSIWYLLFYFIYRIMMKNPCHRSF